MKAKYTGIFEISITDPIGMSKNLQRVLFKGHVTF